MSEVFEAIFEALLDALGSTVEEIPKIFRGRRRRKGVEKSLSSQK